MDAEACEKWLRMKAEQQDEAARVFPKSPAATNVLMLLACADELARLRQRVNELESERPLKDLGVCGYSTSYYGKPLKCVLPDGHSGPHENGRYGFTSAPEST
jgi:hypothetical protein